MAALFDVARSSTEFTGGKTRRCSHGDHNRKDAVTQKRQGSRRGPLALTEEHARAGVKATGRYPNVSGTFQKSSISTASASVCGGIRVFLQSFIRR